MLPEELGARRAVAMPVEEAVEVEAGVEDYWVLVAQARGG